MGIFYKLLSVPQNVTMDLNNVMSLERSMSHLQGKFGLFEGETLLGLH